jgi:transcriptional regulator GlxA family with amidase domain
MRRDSMKGDGNVREKRGKTKNVREKKRNGEYSVPVSASEQSVSVQSNITIQREQTLHMETDKVTLPGTNVTPDQVRQFQQVDKSLRDHRRTAKTLRSDCQHGSYFIHGVLLYGKFSLASM